MAERYQDKSFQGSDRYGRGRDATPESDPLAELARLIGQTDPFTGQHRPQPSAADAAAPRAPAQPTVPPQPTFEEEQPPMPSWLRNRGRDTAFRASEPEFQVERPSAAPEPYRPPQVYQPENYQPENYQQGNYQPESYQPDSYQQPDPYQADPYKADPYRQEPSFAAPQPVDPTRYDDALYGQMPPQYVDPMQETSAYPDPNYGYGNYDEREPAKPRRGGMLTVAAVVALAVIGTGGAFAYRTFMGSPRSGEPPIIKADPGPTKVVPPSAAEASKPIQDRMASGAGTEMLVSREEQPQDPSKYGSRVVLPPLTQNSNPPTPASVAPANKPLAAAPSSNAGNGEEPRKIKTVPVRPDQADAAAGRPAQRAAPAPAPTATRTPPPPVANANASTGAPLSLAPQAEPRSRVAAIAPTAQPEAGGYVVQISSQRSAADAQASFRALQGKYPSVLGSRTPLIKRADLGNKGVYYRAMIGPFGSSDDAARFCGSLRSAGGQCVVQRN